MSASGPRDDAPRERAAPTIDPLLLELLVCPQTGGPLAFDETAQELVSERAGLAYPVRSGLPVLLISEARALDE